MKKIKISIVLFFIIILCSCGIKGKLHTEEELKEYTDELICNPRTKETCNLKDNYKVVKIKETDDSRTIVLKVKNTDLEFETISYLECTGSIDGSCFESTYTMRTTYGTEAFKYLKEKYNKKINYQEELCYNYRNEPECSATLKITTKEELEYFLIYYRGFIEYLNNQELILPDSEITIVTPYNNHTYYLDIGIEYIEGKYYPVYSKNYVPLNGDLENYIMNFFKKNGIELK